MWAKPISDFLKDNWSVSLGLVLACTLLMALAATPLHAQFTYADLYDFYCDTGGGCLPYDVGQLTEGADGNLYGTASFAGALDSGTVFKVTPGGAYTKLWDFDGVTGAVPHGGLTLATDGNFYGTTLDGGTFFDGTLFRMTASGVLTVLHNFKNPDSSEASPVEAADSNLYGSTLGGMTYRVTLPAGTFKKLPNNAPGGTWGQLFPAYGYLYGTTYEGGKYDRGTVFRMTTKGDIKIIYNFSGTDGSRPFGNLTLGSDGELYGTTHDGGANGAGEVFKLTLSGVLTVLHSFDALSGLSCNNDGGAPSAGLLAATDGYFYGVTQYGGDNCTGTIFRITGSGIFSKIFDFTECGTCVNPIIGGNAYSTLMKHTDGLFYGVTAGRSAPIAGMSEGNFYSLGTESLTHIVKVVGPIWVFPGVPVQFLGSNLEGAISVSFGAVPSQFRVGSNNYLIAQVPSDAIDGPVIVTLATGEQIESETTIHILPVITNLDPSSGAAGARVGIVGGGFTEATKVTFGGVKATNFTVVSPTLIQATVPTGAKTGKVRVTTPNSTAASKAKFTVD